MEEREREGRDRQRDRERERERGAIGQLAGHDIWGQI